MKKILLFLLISVFGFVLVACGNGNEIIDEGKSPNETPLAEGFTSLANKNANPELDSQGYYTVAGQKFKANKVYKTYYTTELDGSKFNYLINSWQYNSEQYTNMVDGLIENDQYGNLVGALAVGYKVEKNDDGSETWTLQLKEGVKWIENDTNKVYGEVVADDFVAGLEYVLDPINGSETATIVMGLIKNSKEYYEALATEETTDDIPFAQVGIEAVSDYQIAYTLYESTPYFLSNLTYSPFLPVSRQFLGEVGTDFGQTENDILVNGAFRMTKHVDSNMIVYTKNQRYYDAKHVYVDTVEKRYVPNTATPATTREWYEADLIDGFNVNSQDETGYKKYVTGEDMTGTISNPANPQTNGILVSTDATFIGYFNFARTYWDYVNSADTKTQAQKDATAKALLNVNFRKGFLYGYNAIEHLKYFLKDDPTQRLSRSYTIPELAVYNGRDYTDYVDEVFNREQGTTGISLIGIKQKSDPIYDLDKATAFFQTAKTELINSGALTAADFPIQIDVIGNRQAVRKGFEDEANRYLQQAGQGVIKIVTNVPRTDAENTSWGSIVSNYDFSLWSGWGPDYADPKTFLHTFAIKGDMVDKLGFKQLDAANIALEQQVLGAYDELYRKAAAITDVSKTDERYKAFAEAEYALIYEYAIIVPWYCRSGYTPNVSKVVPYQVGRATYGLTADKLKNIVVSDTVITKDIRTAIKTAYDSKK